LVRAGHDLPAFLTSRIFSSMRVVQRSIPGEAGRSRSCRPSRASHFCQRFLRLLLVAADPDKLWEAIADGVTYGSITVKPSVGYWIFRSIMQPIPEDEKAGAYPTRPAHGYWELNELASVASLAGHPSSSGAPSRSWVFPSLLGSYAVMMLSDLAGGNQVRICQHCGAPFPSAAYKTFYCSP
jgi:hypothetical protein